MVEVSLCGCEGGGGGCEGGGWWRCHCVGVRVVEVGVRVVGGGGVTVCGCEGGGWWRCHSVWV